MSILLPFQVNNQKNSVQPLVDNRNQGTGELPQSAAIANTTVDVSDVKTITVGNISQTVTGREIREFFSFSGEIKYVEMLSETENTQLSYVTFKDAQGADTAILLSVCSVLTMLIKLFSF